LFVWDKGLQTLGSELWKTVLGSITGEDVSVARTVSTIEEGHKDQLLRLGEETAGTRLHTERVLALSPCRDSVSSSGTKHDSVRPLIGPELVIYFRPNLACLCLETRNGLQGGQCSGRVVGWSLGGDQ
jgi:hypothetical protein